MKKTILFLLFAALVIGGCIAWSQYSQKVYYNEDDVIGNTAGNLYNGGLYCEIGDTIYFANPADDGMFYSMASDCTNVKKLSTDKVASLNADSHYVYYSRRNYDKEVSTIGILSYRNTGIYRYTRKNGRLTMLFDGANLISCLYGNTIYYQHYDDKTLFRLFRVDIDQKNAGIVNTSNIIPASIYNGTLYYAGVSGDHYIHALDLATGADTSLVYDSTYMPIAMPGGIYYISASDNYAIYRAGYDGSEPVKLVDDFCSTYNITPDERYLFYQIDGGEDNRIVRMDLTTGVAQTIMDGNYKQIHITSQYVFFTDYTEAFTYAYERATGTVNIFEPPVLEVK